MLNISNRTLIHLRKIFPPGTRVELIRMDDAYNTTLQPGATGTVVTVDDIGTIHVHWDCSSSLGVIYEIDECKRIDNNSQNDN